MNLADVTQFIIVPPFGEEWADDRREQLHRRLCQRFKGYAFRIPTVALVLDSEAFTIVPVMNFIDDSGRARMCNEPPKWLKTEIQSECEAFAKEPTNFTAEVHSIFAGRRQ